MLRLGLLLLLSTLLQGIVAIAPGQLGITLDHELAEKNYFVYKSYVVFNENVQTDWTPEQFLALVAQAHADMLEAWESSTAGMSKNAKLKRRPLVMSAIAIGNTVSFSSSAKSQGRSLFYEPNKGEQIDKGIPTVLSVKAHQCPAVAQALRRCSITAPGDDKHMIHMTSASCGEEWAAYQYCLEHPDADFTGARIVAWENPDGTGKIKPPCDAVLGSANFGCSRFVQELELDVIPEGTATDFTRDPGTISCTWPSFCNSPSS